MSTENISMEQHLTFVNKMRERVRGTDLEPIWDRLHAYITKINDLNDEKKTALDAMMKKVFEKIEHFKKISERRLETINIENKSDHELDGQFEFSPPSVSQASSTPASQASMSEHKFIKPKQKFKKLNRFRMPQKKHPLIVMSPRGDNIPVMRIRLSEILHKRRQKEEKKKNKKTNVPKKATDPIENNEELPIVEQTERIEENIENIPEILPAIENIVQNHQDNNIPMEVERINEMSGAFDAMNDNNDSDHGLKQCSIVVKKCGAETVEISDANLEPLESSSTHVVLEKIPIEKSRHATQNSSKEVDEQESILIEDSDDDDNMLREISVPTQNGKNVQNGENSQNGEKSQNGENSQNNKNSQNGTPRKAGRPRTKSLFQESPKKPNKNQEQSNVPQTSSQKSTKTSSSPQPKIMRLDTTETLKNSDDSKNCIVTIKTVDLPIRPLSSAKPSEPTTPHVVSQCTDILKKVSQSAPAAKNQGTKRNRNSIDTLPNPKSASQKSIRQSVRQAVRRNSVAVRTIDFDQPSTSMPKETAEKSKSIQIISVESIQQPPSIQTKVLNSQPEKTIKKLPNARKSTQSNKVMPSYDLPSCSQTPNKSNQHMAINVDDSEVDNLSNTFQVPQHISMGIKNEPMSPKGYMTPPMTEIPTSNVIIQAQKDKKLVLLSAENTLSKIRPWLMASEHRKFLKNCENMLANGYCLSALFKCMGSTCSYYTDNPNLFLRHLKIHQQKQANDMKYFSQCAYCSFIDDSPEALVRHIKETHGYSKYQCAYCFFRSCDYHIHTHHKLFHPLKSEVIIECKPVKELSNEAEFSTALKNVMNVCRPIICCNCKFKFYNIKNFENHYKAYKTVPSSRCLHCKFEITQETIMDHLKECHKFGDNNCAFCSFASDSSDSMKIHLSNVHYDKPMLYFDRTSLASLQVNGSAKKEDILKSVVLKKLIHQEKTNTKNIKIFNDLNELENAHNINTGLLEKYK